jgi:BNR repeat-like domain/RTX calcium-binding nonapeptide repeat (4 copies)
VRRAFVACLVALTLVAGAARAALFRGTDGPDKLVGTGAADTIYGLAGPDALEGRGGNDLIVPGFGRDRVIAGAGNDRIAAQDGAVDQIACGTGNDTVTADPEDVVGKDCETVSRQISRDTTSDFFAQHATQVEPDSFAWGKTVVTAFQSGRIATGGAAALGFATSLDGGASWKSGNLPQGGYSYVSDPVVAYDALHDWWLVAGLGARPGLDVYVTRSRDGLKWHAPMIAAGDVDEDYDKEWLACDNGMRSKFRGTCYLAYVDIRTRWLALRTTRDGGATWSNPMRIQPGIAGATFSGPMPVVQPDGDVVVPYVLYAPISDGEDRMAAVISHDGGATWSAPVRIAGLSYEEPFELRAPTMPSVDVDAAGRLYIVWSDSRFRTDGQSMDVVLSTSGDGVKWSAPAHLPAEAGTSLAFIPSIAVEPGTSGKKAHLAVTYYTMHLPERCHLFVPGCGQQVNACLAESKDGGATWGARRRLNGEPMSLDWLSETTLGRMLGDYVSVSWSDGRAIPVLSIAGEPSFTMAQAIFATRAAS